MTDSEETKHPRTLGWVGTAALAMGGSNQSLFLIAGATGLIASQGSAAIPLLALGLLLAWMAAPGWTELVLMWPDRVGGIAATCAEAFRPYSPVLANLTGTCYWWGRVPACGLAALFSASAIHQWYLPHVPVPALAVGLVAAFTGDQPLRGALGRPAGDPRGVRVGRPGLPFGAAAGDHRPCGLAAGGDVPPGHAVPRPVRGRDRRDGRALSDRLRRPRL